MTVADCECWLVISKAKRGFNMLRVERMTAKTPSVGPRQIAVKVELTLPLSLFVEPALTARIRVADGVAPERITAETVAGLESALQEAGFVVRVVADQGAGDSK